MSEKLGRYKNPRVLFSIGQEGYDALMDLSDQTGITQAELLRRGVDMLLKSYGITADVSVERNKKRQQIRNRANKASE